MIRLTGIAVSQGVVIAEAFVLDREDVTITDRFVAPEHMPDEIARFQHALDVASQEIDQLQQKAAEEFGAASAAIFQAHFWILNDPAFQQEVYERIESNHFTAEYAIDRAMRKFIRKLQKSNLAFLQERTSDFEDIERRLINVLQGEQSQSLSNLKRPVVLIAHDLTPSQTFGLDRKMILAFATDRGGRTSHTAILARDLGLPAVVGLGEISGEVSLGDTVIVDGTRGVVVVAPDEQTLADYESQRANYAVFSAGLFKEMALPAVTLDGVEIDILGNIEFPMEIEDVLRNGGIGIGLYRTEFLYLDVGHMPDEDEHLHAYKQAIALLDGRPITIRTLDLGADKVFPGDRSRREPNPFLGCRSIRMCQLHPEIFRPQMRAILRVSPLGSVRVLLPMITTIDEILWVREFIEDVKAELSREGLPFREDLEMGAMIEVPAAALIANSLAPHVDFFSIGTNDLIQYTLAVDRTNTQVASLFNPAHPAVLELIERVIEAGRECDVGVSICGEMAGEPIYTLLLLGMGLRKFSIAAGIMPEIKKIIRSVSNETAREIHRTVRQQNDPSKILDYLAHRTNEILPGAIP